MSKTLTANLGLSAVALSLPPRITLERNSMTIKTGVASSKSYPYSAIAEVRHKGLTSLNSTLYILPYRGAEIKLLGFSKSDFKLIQQAVADGFFDDANAFSKTDDEEAFDESDSRSFENNVSKKEQNILNSEGEDVLKMNVDISNENELVNALNSLITIIETKGERSADVEDAGKAKFANLLAVLRTSHPQNKLLPYFESKPIEWKKKNSKTILIALICIFGGFGLLVLLVLFAL